MLHVRRLIDIAIEIANTGTFTVLRPNTKYLLDIKHGKYNLEEIVSDVERDIAGLDVCFKNSTLPDKVDKNKVKEILLKIRHFN